MARAIARSQMDQVYPGRLHNVKKSSTGQHFLYSHRLFSLDVPDLKLRQVSGILMMVNVNTIPITCSEVCQLKFDKKVIGKFSIPAAS
jgi:hypothetical protein